MIITEQMRGYPNAHQERADAFFRGTPASLDAIPSDLRFVFVCYTNRSGSHFLADCLASSGQLNNAGEFFHADLITSDCEAFGLRDLGAFTGWMAEKHARNGFLLSKTSVTQLFMLASAGILDQVRDRASFVLLERCDKLAQAISYAIALQTGSWTSEQETNMTPASARFTPDVVSGFLDGATIEMLLFDRFFSRNGIIPFRIVYEELESDPNGIVGRVGRWLHIDKLRFEPAGIRLERQRSEVNERWRREFLEWQHSAGM